MDMLAQERMSCGEKSIIIYECGWTIEIEEEKLKKIWMNCATDNMGEKGVSIEMIADRQEWTNENMLYRAHLVG